MSNSKDLDTNKQDKKPPAPEASIQAAPEAEQPRPKHKKMAARVFFNAVNFLGLHWVGNSTLSLWITYNIISREGTQKMLHGLAKAFTPIADGWDKLKGMVGLSGLGKLSKEERAGHILHSSRSFIETLCMCVAGCVILFPVKLWENNRNKIINKTDAILHPGRDNSNDPPLPEHNESWGKLLATRFLSLVPIFAIDNRIQAFNNARFSAGKWSPDTKIWQAGARLYDNMRPSWRERFVKFFSSKGARMSKVQYLVRDQLLESIGSPEELKGISREMRGHQEEMLHHSNGKLPHLNAQVAHLETQIVDKNLQNHAQRAIFAEQARLFSKEVYLTLVYTGFLFALGKLGIPYVMKKLGFNKKEQKEVEHALKHDVGLDVFDAEPSAESKKTFTQRLTPASRDVLTPATSHADRAQKGETSHHLSA